MRRHPRAVTSALAAFALATGSFALVRDGTFARIIGPNAQHNYQFSTHDGTGIAAALTNYLAAPITDIVPTPDGRGYWLVAADGGVFDFGDAGFYGNTYSCNPGPCLTGLGGSHPLAAEIVGLVPTPNGGGYWLVGADGGIFSFGNAGFYGNTYSYGITGLGGSTPLGGPIVAMAATPNGQGYWLVGSDGGVFNFGNAGYYGSTYSCNPGPCLTGLGGSHPLAGGIVGIIPTPDGGGYWLIAADGGTFAFGDANAFPFPGNDYTSGPGYPGYSGMGGSNPLPGPVIAGVPGPESGQYGNNAGGYTLINANGGVNSFANGPYNGSLPGNFGVDGDLVTVPPNTGSGWYPPIAAGPIIAAAGMPNMGVTTQYQQVNANSYTINAWISTTTAPTQSVLVGDRGTGAGQSLTLNMNGCPGDSSAALCFGLDSNGTYIGVGTANQPSMNNGQWYMVTGVWTGDGGGAVSPSQFELFINGQQVATTPIAIGSGSGSLTGLGETLIGNTDAGYPWNGYSGGISGVVTSMNAWSPAQIQALYNASSNVSNYINTANINGANNIWMLSLGYRTPQSSNPDTDAANNYVWGGGPEAIYGSGIQFNPSPPPWGGPTTQINQTGSGYWMVGADGTVYAFGSAQNYGSIVSTGLDGLQNNPFTVCTNNGWSNCIPNA